MFSPIRLALVTTFCTLNRKHGARDRAELQLAKREHLPLSSDIGRQREHVRDGDEHE